VGYREGGAGARLAITRTTRPDRGGAPVSAQPSTTLRGDASRPSCLDRGRRSTDHSTVVPNPRISAGSTVGITGPAPARPRGDTRRSPRPYPAASADRYWVGGLLGGLDGACYAATPRHSASLARQDTCVSYVTDLTNGSHINGRLQPRRLMVTPAAVACKPCWADDSGPSLTPRGPVRDRPRWPECARVLGVRN
jgi:hypothetical protein